MEQYYEAIDSDGSRLQRNQARLGKTELQIAALKVTRTERQQFESREQHEAFKDLEEKASPFKRTEEGKLYAAWIKKCIQDAESYNRKVRNTNMNGLIRDISRDDKRLVWLETLTEDQKNEILEKRKIAPAAKLKPASGLPRPAYVKKVADEVADIIAKFEKELGVNIRYTTSNLEHARLIVEDGRSIDVFMEWLKKDEWKAEHLDIYKSLSKVWEIWPKAFEQVTAGLNPQGLGIE